MVDWTVMGSNNGILCSSEDDLLCSGTELSPGDVYYYCHNLKRLYLYSQIPLSLVLCISQSLCKCRQWDYEFYSFLPFYTKRRTFYTLFCSLCFSLGNMLVHEEPSCSSLKEVYWDVVYIPSYSPIENVQFIDF